MYVTNPAGEVLAVSSAAAVDRPRPVEVGNVRQKFDHTASFTPVEKDGVTIGARSDDGKLQYVAASSKAGRELARSEGREDLIPEDLRGLPLAAKVAIGLAAGAGAVVLGAAIVRKVRRGAR